MDGMQKVYAVLNESLKSKLSEEELRNLIFEVGKANYLNAELPNIQNLLVHRLGMSYERTDRHLSSIFNTVSIEDQMILQNINSALDGIV